MKYRKFDVVLVDFGNDTLGSEQGGIRPAIIVQGNTGNIHSTTALAMPCSTKIKNMYQPTHTLIRKGKESGLKHDSVLLGECMRQISELRIKKQIGAIIDPKTQQAIKRVYDAGFND